MTEEELVDSTPLETDEEPERSVGEAVQELGHNLVEGYHEIEEQYLTSKDQLYELNRKTRIFIQEHPAAAIAGAFTIGFVVGKLAKHRWFT